MNVRWMMFRRWLAKRLWVLIYPVWGEVPEIRPNGDRPYQHDGDCDDVDEVCGFGFLHVEQMDDKCYWARLTVPNGQDVVMWFNSRGKIKLRAEFD